MIKIKAFDESNTKWASVTTALCEDRVDRICTALTDKLVPFRIDMDKQLYIISIPEPEYQRCWQLINNIK